MSKNSERINPTEGREEVNEIFNRWKSDLDKVDVIGRTSLITGLVELMGNGFEDIEPSDAEDFNKLFRYRVSKKHREKIRSTPSEEPA